MTDRAERANVPFRLNLEQQRKRAKDLHRAMSAVNQAALARFAVHHPKDVPTAHSLADAQLVVARELGLPSWPRLKAHVAAMERERAAITRRAGAPDGEMRTLHIRCGSDIGTTLADSGFIGDLLEYSDPFCQGPVTDGPDFVALRARFLAEAYGKHGGFSYPEAASKLQHAEKRLTAAAADYQRVVLWMEHDSYDQLVLIRCLAQFAARAPEALELISINHFPGSARFIGLGQLPPEAMRLLWPRRRPVTSEQLKLGAKAWTALKSGDPRTLATIARDGTPALPDLSSALRRHLQELPWVGTGLSLTQRLIFEILAEESRTIGQAFARLMAEREPLPWLGDLMFLHIIEAMGQVSPPVFEVADEDDASRWRLSITPLGRTILAGAQDWPSLDPPERWVGGVRLRSGGPVWRWDDTRAGVVVM